jgi:excisionase family DNA binding protein
MNRSLPDPRDEPTLTVARVAAILNVSKAYVYVLINDGEIPSLKVGSRIVIPTAKLLAKYELTPAA